MEKLRKPRKDRAARKGGLTKERIEQKGDLQGVETCSRQKKTTWYGRKPKERGVTK